MQKASFKNLGSLPEYDRPFVTGSYFGFIPMPTPKILDKDIEAVISCGEHPHYDAVERAAFIRTYIEQNFAELPHPLALIYRKGARKFKTSRTLAPGGYTLHYIGAPSAVAEAALIRTTISILNEEGHKSLKLELNSIGDKESFAAHEKELNNYIKKFGGHLRDDLKQILKQNVFNLFTHEDESLRELKQSAPQSISHLSAAARAHFKEVLEFVEGLGIEFGLSPNLLGEREHSSHTVFNIKHSEGEETLALGYRYSRLSKKLGLKKEIPMASCTIFIGDKNENKKIYKDLPKPKFYLIQLGQEAKIRTLGILEFLRQEKIRVHHFLGKDKLSQQLGSAEELGVPYLIIIGHKEALDGTATVRNMETRAQETIPMEALPGYLKNIKL